LCILWNELLHQRFARLAGFHRHAEALVGGCGFIGNPGGVFEIANPVLAEHDALHRQARG
jgi:hypothetical protein